MNRASWAERDGDWLARYRRSMAGRHVPAAALAERESELLGAVGEAGVPAAELFGDAAALAAEDAAELATVDEAVRTSEGGGLRPALREVGGTLVAIGGVAAVLTVVRDGWSVDIEVASVLVGASVALVFVGWAVARALFAAGRPIPTVGVLVAVGAAALGGIAAAVSVGSDVVVARDVPVPALGVVLLAPGILTLLTASRMPQPRLRESWDDAEWLRRFAHGLRTRLVPSATARGHVAEVERAIGAGTESAFAEFGHPLVLARQLADADRTARARRWWASTVTGTGTPLVVAALILSTDSWNALTVPVVLVLVVSAVLTPVVGWGDRPWVGRT